MNIKMEEDNLIEHLNRASLSAVFQGDDTWTYLFPDGFIRTHPMDSFDVTDINSVDNTVIKNIFPNMKENDWNLMIGN